MTAIEKSFTYGETSVNDIEVVTTIDPKGKPHVSSVIIQGEEFIPSPRFWISLFSRFGFNKSFFKYFTYSEVFERISEVRSSENLRFCVERTEHLGEEDVNRLLAVSNPSKPIVSHQDLMGLLEANGCLEGVRYFNGIIDSNHTPRSGSRSCQIAGDGFLNKFMISTPIDGFGAPTVALSLLRDACKNGVIAASPAFRSKVQLGKSDDNTEFALLRVLDQFNNEEGYSELRQRIDSSATSWASVYETSQLYKLLLRLHLGKDDFGLPIIGCDGEALASGTSPYVRKLIKKSNNHSATVSDDIEHSSVIQCFHEMTGDTSKIYGLANIDTMSAKRQRTMPVNATVYDLFNFATELSTHHTTPEASRLLESYVGDLICREYDMEGTKNNYSDFADFHLEAKNANQLTGSQYTQD